MRFKLFILRLFGLPVYIQTAGPFGYMPYSLDWQHTLAPFQRRKMTRRNMYDLAVLTNYPFYVFNGQVYRTMDYEDGLPTIYRLEDVK